MTNQQESILHTIYSRHGPAFTSLANEFERFVEREFPKAHRDPKMFVREVRRGSIEADIFTGLTVYALPTAAATPKVTGSTGPRSTRCIWVSSDA